MQSNPDGEECHKRSRFLKEIGISFGWDRDRHVNRNVIIAAASFDVNLCLFLVYSTGT